MPIIMVMVLFMSVGTVMDLEADIPYNGVGSGEINWLDSYFRNGGLKIYLLGSLESMG